MYACIIILLYYIYEKFNIIVVEPMHMHACNAIHIYFNCGFSDLQCQSTYTTNSIFKKSLECKCNKCMHVATYQYLCFWKHFCCMWDSLLNIIIYMLINRVCSMAIQLASMQCTVQFNMQLKLIHFFKTQPACYDGFVVNTPC